MPRIAHTVSTIKSFSVKPMMLSRKPETLWSIFSKLFDFLMRLHMNFEILKPIKSTRKAPMILKPKFIIKEEAALRRF